MTKAITISFEHLKEEYEKAEQTYNSYYLATHLDSLDFLYSMSDISAEIIKAAAAFEESKATTAFPIETFYKQILDQRYNLLINLRAFLKNKVVSQKSSSKVTQELKDKHFRSLDNARIRCAAENTLSITHPSTPPGSIEITELRNLCDSIDEECESLRNYLYILQVLEDVAAGEKWLSLAKFFHKLIGRIKRFLIFWED